MPEKVKQYIYVLKKLNNIPEGKVSTYKDLALACDLNTPRLVGWILHHNPSNKKYPCHRVVGHNGRLAPNFAFGGKERQRQKLLEEGVTFKKDKVDMKKCHYKIFI